MRVLLINNRHFHGGGSDVVYFTTGELLKAAGHDIRYFSRHSCDAEPYEFEEFFAPDKEKLRPLEQVRAYFNNQGAAEALDRLLCEERFDIAHAHLMWGGMTASIIPILHKHGIPLVHSVHDYRMVCPAYTFRNGKGKVCEQCKGGAYLNCIINKCCKGSLSQSILMAMEMRYRNKKWHPANEIDGLIYVSNFAKEKLEEIDPLFARIRSIVLYNFTTVGAAYPQIDKTEAYYLYYGRLSEEKGVGTLIDAFSQFPELSLKVVGTGPMEDELKKRKGENVEFLGFKRGEELYNFVRKARFVCIPSEWYENNPMTVVEAYSMGVPVIGARIGGIPEIIEEGKTGFLFESGSVESLVKVIENTGNLNEADYVRMKHSASLFADKHFNSKAYPERLVAFYREVIEEYAKSKG